MEIGKRFGCLTFVGKSDKKYGQSRGWIMKCDCGTVKVMSHGNVLSGASRSCGCVRTNKYAGSAEMAALHAAIGRCHNPKDKDFPNYGGRGVAVCDAWRRRPQSFVDHIGLRPTSRHSLDRIKNDRGYEPGNVRWATKREQSRNRRSVSTITIDGEVISFIEHCENIGLPYDTFLSRYQKKGWPLEEALDLRHGHTIKAERRLREPVR